MPPGTSKWNKNEHRLFSHISTNWRGRTGIKLTDKDIDALPMHRHRFHGDWELHSPRPAPRHSRRGRRTSAGQGPALTVPR